MGVLGAAPRVPSLGGMDPTQPNPHALENFQAWQLARTLAVRAYRVTQQSAFKDHPWLAQSIRDTALDAPGNLARGHEAPRGRFEREFHYELAKSECARLQTLLAIASDLGLLKSDDGLALHEGCEGTRRIIAALLKASYRRQGMEEAEDEGPAAPKVRPSGSPGPSRRPPASGGGSRGGDPWDTRS